ncbi:MAG: hypothetical protein R2867_31920 [Caldilineaceae bacterium]
MREVDAAQPHIDAGLRQRVVNGALEACLKAFARLRIGGRARGIRNDAVLLRTLPGGVAEI